MLKSSTFEITEIFESLTSSPFSFTNWKWLSCSSFHIFLTAHVYMLIWYLILNYVLWSYQCYGNDPRVSEVKNYTENWKDLSQPQSASSALSYSVSLGAFRAHFKPKHPHPKPIPAHAGTHLNSCIQIYESISMTKFNNIRVKRVKSNLKYTDSNLVNKKTTLKRRSTEKATII